MDKIKIRATKLETFITCPYKYKYEPEPDDDAEPFRLGSALHKYIELILHNQLNETTEWMVLQERGVKQRLMFRKMADMVVDKVKEKEYTLVCSERTNKVMFDDINIELQWTFDHLFQNKDWEYILMDIKTAKSKRDQEHKDWVRQNVIYPALLELKYWIKISAFEYRVMTKTSNPSFEDICFSINWSPSWEVIEALQNLRDSTEKNLFPPKFWNYMCRYCKCRDVCKSYDPNNPPTK